MNTVILYGTDREGAVVNTLFAFIRAIRSGFLHVTSKSLSLISGPDESVDYVILENSPIRDYHIPAGILVFKPEIAGMTDEIAIPRNCVAVLDPNNDPAVTMMKNRNIRTITCGLSQKDTVTFSSLTETGAVISLQREIRSLHGQDMLPREIPVTFTDPKREYPLLAAAAVLLLAGADFPDEGMTV